MGQLKTRNEFAVEYEGGFVAGFLVSQMGTSGYDDIMVQVDGGDAGQLTVTPNLDDLEGMAEALAVAIKHIKRARKVTDRKGDA